MTTIHRLSSKPYDYKSLVSQRIKWEKNATFPFSC
jgi:hypothetical protein